MTPCISVGKKVDGCYPLLASDDTWIGDIPDKSVARKIAHCLNCYDDLLAALVAIMDTYNDGGTPLTKAFQMANAARAKAEGR